jgi:hypothetical protein
MAQDEVRDEAADFRDCERDQFAGWVRSPSFAAAIRDTVVKMAAAGAGPTCARPASRAARRRPQPVAVAR